MMKLARATPVMPACLRISTTGFVQPCGLRLKTHDVNASQSAMVPARNTLAFRRVAGQNIVSGAMKFIGQCRSEVESLAGWHNR